MIRAARTLRQVGAVFVALAAATALSCTSSTELDEIRSQLREIHFELLELRKQGPSKAEVAAMEAGLSQEISRLARAQSDTQLELSGLADQIEQLEAKLEDTTFRLIQLSQQIEATNQELQAIRSAAEVARLAPAVPPPSSPSQTADPQALYDTAYNDYVRGSYDLAVLGFRQYLESYPETDLADNATYWIGECYFQQRKFQEAIVQFDKVLTRYELSDRNPSSLLKKGFAYLELGQRAEGVVQLQNVVCEYAGSDEARLAGQRLQALGIDVDCEEP